MPRVLLVDNTLHPRLFGLARRWTSAFRDVPVDVVRAATAAEWPRLDGHSHLVLTGSEASIPQWTPWMAQEATYVQDAVATGLRVLGSCFGHEMLVAALSGREHVRRAPRLAIGWTPVQIVVRDHLLQGVPDPWDVFSFHAFEVAAPPPSPWRVLARSARCDAEIIRFGDLPVWGIQGHPEISRRTSEFATRAYFALSRRRGGVPRAALRVPAAGDRVLRDVVDRFLADADGSSD